jgi:N-acetylglucosamine kinase-like BadF-type ATPase
MDITTRLRRWTHDANAVPASDLMDEAASEIERLREAIRRLAEQDATLSVCGGAVKVTMDGTLTDEERQAIREGADAYESNNGDADCERIAATLRALLDRTK